MFFVILDCNFDQFPEYFKVISPVPVLVVII